MKPIPFKLALIQMEVLGGEKERNIQHAVELISDAASAGAQVTLLPECLDLGWTHPSSRTLAEEIPGGAVCQAMMQAAKEHAVYVCCGLTERAGKQIFNSAIIIDKHGEILCKHRKLNELEIGRDFYAQGDRLNVAETEFGTFGLMICADAFAEDHVVSRSLCYMGADVILSPCAWAVRAEYDNNKVPYGQFWRDSYIPVAREFSVAIVAVSCVGNVVDGPWAGRECIGSSLAISASGEETLRGPFGTDAECIMYIDMGPVAGNRSVGTNK